MTDAGMTWGQIAGLMTLVTFAIVVGGVAVRQAVWSSRNEASAKAAQAIANEAKTSALQAATLAAQALTAAQNNAIQALKDLADFREKVAKEYATHDALRHLEEGLLKAIEKLGDRFERYVEARPPRHDNDGK